MKDIAVYGSGGYGREVVCLIESINKVKPTWNFIGFIDDVHPAGASNRKGTILGGIDTLNAWDKPLSVVITINIPEALQSIVSRITNKLIDFPNLISPTAIFRERDSLQLGRGNIINDLGLISSNVRMGDFNLLNGRVSVGHDTVLGSFNSIGPSSCISGNVTIGDCNFFGVGSLVLEKINIGNRTRIGAGAAIMRDTKEGFLYIGNPAKMMKQ